ncbi:hypothetical protein LOTGIDRAFT_174229 [Lottia gigantea]|uniref:Uncharacterized protein n=1 Tax=Lottia gigantea TaxID=225164 RepID=V4A3P0_LOTGI|nr:hypothetical protein LOTGIDRAFT_174229 [Lottia gigantea]ESO98503.1 hypothetical protein LOTGIDRAFT_174229 [Lottia gigantea]
MDYDIKEKVYPICFINQLYIALYSDGGFLSHNTSRDTYPTPIPTKVVNYNSELSKSADPLYDLPAYDDFKPMLKGILLRIVLICSEKLPQLAVANKIKYQISALMPDATASACASTT